MPLAPESGKDAEELLKAANDAAGHARILYVTLMLFLLYCAITAVSVTDEQLFRNGPIAIPLLPEAKVPVSVFFLVGPWLVLILHLDVLLHFHGLAEKIRSFDLSATSLLPKGRERLRHRFAGFPFLAWLANPASLPRWVRWLYGVIVYVTLVLAPLGVLLLMQFLFLKYQSPEITWLQRVALLADCVLVWNFWPHLVAKPTDGAATALGPRPNRLEGLRRFLRSSFRYKRVRLLAFIVVGASFCIATVIGEGIDRLIWGPMSEIEYDNDRNLHIKINDKSFVFNLPIPTDWRRLNLRERFLSANSLPPEKQEEARNEAATVFDPALKAIEGIDLRGRNLRFVDLADAALPKGDFRGADLSYAGMQRSDIKTARFDEAKLIGANLSEANAVGGAFVRANLLGADLSKANLIVTDFTLSRLDLTDLSGAQLLGSDLTHASVRGAIIRYTNFFSSNMQAAEFKFSIVSGSYLDNKSYYQYYSHRNNEKYELLRVFENSVFVFSDKINLNPSILKNFIIGELDISYVHSGIDWNNWAEILSVYYGYSQYTYKQKNVFNLTRENFITESIKDLEKMTPINIHKTRQDILKHFTDLTESQENHTTAEFYCIGPNKQCERNFSLQKPGGLALPRSRLFLSEILNPAYTPQKYFDNLFTFICSNDFSDLPLAAAKRLITPARAWVGPITPQSPHGGDWPNFEAEAQKTWDKITNTSCKDRFKFELKHPLASYSGIETLN